MSMCNSFYGTLSSTSLSLNSDEVRRIEGDSVRVMLLQDGHRAVLMEDTDRGWDVPCFRYKRGIERGDRMTRVCRDFTRWFDQDIQFVAVVELIGSWLTKDEEDRRKDVALKLVVMERVYNSGAHELALPERAEWKDAGFLSGVVEGLREIDHRTKPLKIVLSCLQPGTNVLSSVAEPRHKFGWFQQASDFLNKVISADGCMLEGPVIQNQMSASSTVLVGRSAGRRYFLKAPARGSNEIQISVKVSSLLEGYVPEVLAASSELGCFVTRGFDHCVWNERDLVLRLGQIHLKSLSCMKELKESCCVVRDLDTIRSQIKRWVDGYKTERTESVYYLIEESASYMMDICRRLGELEIPLTLVHGDFSWGNAGYDPPESKNVILFDWEFACISHPFLDFFRMRNKLSEEVIMEYLDLWKEYGDMSVLREGFRIGSLLGRALRVWSLWDRATLCEHQPSSMSSLEDWMRSEIDYLNDVSLEVQSSDKEYTKCVEAELDK